MSGERLGGIPTEQRNPRSQRLDALSVAECITLIQEEDAAVMMAVNSARPALIELVQAIAKRFSTATGGGRIIYVGAGTSGRLGVLDASEIPPTFSVSPDRIIGIIAGGDGALRESSEGSEDDPAGAVAALTPLDLNSTDTVIGLTASGRTPYVLGALQHAKTAAPNCLTALVACSHIGARPAFIDHVLQLETGPEVLTGSTRMKAGTATKLILNALSTTLMVQSARVYENLMVDMHTSNTKLRDRGVRILQELTQLPHARCIDYLERAHGNVKTAAVMALLRIGEDDAKERLAQVGGRLRPLVDAAVTLRNR